MSNKELYGEVSTDINLVSKILDLIPQEKYEDPSLRWLDPACGRGNFMLMLYKRLFYTLAHIMPDELERQHHICKKMLFMVEINEQHCNYLKNLFPDGNIICTDFLSYGEKNSFDIIIGNPPFNSGGLKKVPTNRKLDKKKDGQTIWPSFVHHAFFLLRDGGFLSMITPSIWMKPDKAGIYALLSKQQLIKVRCFSNTQTNRLFHGKAQTPTCFFLAQKAPHHPIISLYETNINRYIPYLHIKDAPLPVFGMSVFSKLQPYVLKVGFPLFYKSSMPPKYSLLSTERNIICSHSNIRTCVLTNNQPTLIYEYSSQPLSFQGQPKLILAHKMYGFPYYDVSGIYGISRRDNYIMIQQSPINMKKWRDFLSTKFALYLFEGTRYRMKYLEKYVFQLIPDILLLDDFPTTINDQSIADYFQLTEAERNAIEKIHTYGSFPL